MQGKRSTVESLPETFEFDLGSSSSNPVMVDSQPCWNNMRNTQNVMDYFLSPNETNVPFAHSANPESEGLNTWNFANPSSSGHAAVNESGLNEAKMEHDWASSLAANTDSVPRLHERRFETSNAMLSLENVDINLNGNQTITQQELCNNLESNFLQSLESHDATQTLDHNEGSAGNGIISDVDACHCSRGCGFNADQVASGSGLANSHGVSRGINENGTETGDGRPSNSFDGRHLSCKRKSIEGFPGQSSVSANSSSRQNESAFGQAGSSHRNLNSSLNISNSSDNLLVVNSTNGTASESDLSSTLAGNAENSLRNVRMRINPANQIATSLPTLQPAGSSSRYHSVWPPQPSSLLVPFNQTRPASSITSSQTEHQQSVVPGLPQYVHPFSWNMPPNSRPVNSSTPLVIAGERFTTLRGEMHPRSIRRNVTTVPSIFIPTNDLHLAQDPINWSLSSGHISLQGNMGSTSEVGSSSAVHPPPPISSTLLPNRNISSQQQLNLEYVRRSISSAVPSSAGQSSNINPQSIGHSSSLHAMVPNRGLRLRGQHQQLIRSASLVDRQNEVANGDPLPQRVAAVRERRSRMISEIRNVLGLLRRNESLRFEDLILDQSVFFGAAADLHDRHRDMRLDVDNMSYEELLALEERIGNVNTGLSDETILKCLKQRKHSHAMSEAFSEVEPCCVCQEEYVEGEDIGALDCGHDFHTACIKQWLMHKNLCPICKTAALVT